ncbi:hypothetical protein WN943_019876 [Citrus x changshan-huyou]
MELRMVGSKLKQQWQKPDRLDGFMVNQQSVFWGYFHSAQPEWQGLLPSNLEDSSSNPHKSIAGVFSSSINLSEGNLKFGPHHHKKVFVNISSLFGMVDVGISALNQIKQEEEHDPAAWLKN